jgi:hypothetical protein
MGLKFSPAALRELEIAGRVDTKFLGYMEGHNSTTHFAPEVNAHIWPSWAFPFGRVILNFGYEWIGASYDHNKRLIGEGTPVALNGGHRMGAGISIHKTIFGNSFVKGGIAYRFAGTVNGVQERAVLTIPLYAEYSF